MRTHLAAKQNRVCVKIAFVRGILLATVILGAASFAGATSITLFLNDVNATQPAINDSEEVAYVKAGQIFSITRGLVVSGIVDASNIGLSNSGEIVYAQGSTTVPSVVISTTRGVLASGNSPTIAPSTGEVVYRSNGNPNIFTTAQGQLSFVDDITHRVGNADVNDHGEVVYEVRDLSTEFIRLFSTTRGFLTAANVSALEPALNNLGETVWSGFDAGNRQQIFSSLRGQLTFFDGTNGFLTADLPDINNQGEIVFRGNLRSPQGDVSALYLIGPVPEPSTWLLLGSGLAGIVIWRRYTQEADSSYHSA